MVHIKRVELNHFKSFKQAQVPFLPGFTVISGPNGSGKSNILDALLFCLNLSTTKGMRADKLPDLVNHNLNNNGSASETIVSVTFDLSDKALEDWTISRRLRVSKGGSYASTFYINSQVVTVAELYEQLETKGIYPEGYNVVLQGDVTRIITMNSRERREIIDELAGVAVFDRKIDQAKQTLESVRHKEEPCYIIEEELNRTLQRLESDRTKAEKYRVLKAKIQERQSWEIVLLWKSLQQQEQNLAKEIEETTLTKESNEVEIAALQIETTEKRAILEQLSEQVKLLGEEEQLKVAQELAQLKALSEPLMRSEQNLIKAIESLVLSSAHLEAQLQQYQQTEIEIEQQKQRKQTEIEELNTQYQQLQTSLGVSREEAEAIATSAHQYIEQQTKLSSQIAEIETILNPQRRLEAQLLERDQQLNEKIAQNQRLQHSLEEELTSFREEINNLGTYPSEVEEESISQSLTNAQGALKLAEDTKQRLLKEQREKQRQVDKLEATKQAQQEAQGTYAFNLIAQEIEGICGLVASLGQVEPRYQLALSIAAGARISYVVVENDLLAAKAIELLKQRRAGRASFLPLNKIQAPRLMDVTSLRHTTGFVDLAVNLIDYQARYRDIFAFVFGNTVVFETLDTARPFLGRHRIVTLEGEILETSGAMTGGSISKSNLQFGVVSGISEETEALHQRLGEIEQILAVNDTIIAEKNQLIQQLTAELNELRAFHREKRLRFEQLEKERTRLVNQHNLVKEQLLKDEQESERVKESTQQLKTSIPTLEGEIAQLRAALAELEGGGSNQQWQQLQGTVKEIESELGKLAKLCRQAEDKYQALANDSLRIKEKIGETEQKIREVKEKAQENQKEQEIQRDELKKLLAEIEIKEQIFEKLALRLKEVKKERDRTESDLKIKERLQQEKTWQQEKLEKLLEDMRSRRQEIISELLKVESQLPNPLPEVPILDSTKEENETQEAYSSNIFQVQLEKLRKEQYSLTKRLEAMEPVNMLALQEYEETKERLSSLSAKLMTLKAERNELLLRIENFTTLRLSAFKEAFELVNSNFQEIFATLSEGDGYLELEDQENPFNGGLNLIAHPKGKPVQRLSSMSGGEKSLTALSFIFALQRYRPSPFYAFDEVDMFLDGANVERLARMIKQQATTAQFIVVSLRRPMIESSQQTIGVTQARGAYTQVLGIKL